MVVKTQGDAPNGRRSHSVWTHNGKMYMLAGTKATKTSTTTTSMNLTLPLVNGVWHYAPSQNDGKSLVDLADLFVLDFEPSLESLCSEAVVRYGFHQRYDHLLPNTLRNQLYFMSASNNITKPNCSRIDCNNG
uniref:Uncharacterized protein n=1 Tax=Ditylenchus dipsaci TaxID=166011 RepID=A0A915CLC9_9BILA